ncbi:hypothetical protein ACFXMO_43265, partial [Kitasatospora indigofera]
MDAENAQPSEQSTGQQQSGQGPAGAARGDGAGSAPLSRRAVIGWAGAGVALGAAAVGSVAVATGSGGPV